MNLTNRNVILGLTGSVASTLTIKMYDALVAAGANVKIVATQAALEFFSHENFGSTVHLHSYPSHWKTPIPPQVFVDKDEWKKPYEKGDDILHIEMRKWANAMVIAPLSANTLAKMANGMCDNLLTSIIRAWDPAKPMIVAPAMNTYMFENPFTDEHLEVIRAKYDAIVVPPISKKLACNDVGVGAMAEIKSVVAAVDISLRWKCPITHCKGIPVGNHPGAYGVKRKHDSHWGVDLYCNDGDVVVAAEDGKIVNFEPFTGPELGHTWWETTSCLLVKGTSGVICYGEINPYVFPSTRPNIGSFVRRGEPIAYVKRVLKAGKERPDIPGHSLSMLHVELYDGTRDDCTSKSADLPFDAPKDPKLMDPTPYLLNCDTYPGWINGLWFDKITGTYEYTLMDTYPGKLEMPEPKPV